MNIPHRLALMIGLLCVAGGSSPAFAAPRTWTGAGPNNLWSTPQNWQGNVAPVAGDGVTFPSVALQTTNVNDLPAGTLFAAIQFLGTYIVSGNRVLIDNNIRLNGQCWRRCPVPVRHHDRRQRRDRAVRRRRTLDDSW